MADDFTQWVKETLLASGKIAPEHLDALTPFVEPLPEDEMGPILGALKEKRQVGKGVVVISRHPRNAFLNLKGLFTSTGATLIGMPSTPEWAVPMLGLVAVVQFVTNMDVELSPDHAKVIHWLWVKKPLAAWVFKSDLEEAVVKELEQHSLNEVLDDLEALRAIEVNEDGSIWKIEYLETLSDADDSD